LTLTVSVKSNNQVHPTEPKKWVVNVRLLVAIVTSLLDEVAILLLVLWVLPKMGVKIPWWGIVIFVVGFIAYAVLTYLIGSRALRLKPMAGFTDMTGTEGKAMNQLEPEGWVKIEGELWEARSEGGPIAEGAKIRVTGQKGLKLRVRGSGR
jgi:membrane-bound ClpP family serine protease